MYLICSIGIHSVTFWSTTRSWNCVKPLSTSGVFVCICVFVCVHMLDSECVCILMRKMSVCVMVWLRWDRQKDMVQPSQWCRKISSATFEWVSHWIIKFSWTHNYTHCPTYTIHIQCTVGGIMSRDQPFHKLNTTCNNTLDIHKFSFTI